MAAWLKVEVKGSTITESSLCLWCLGCTEIEGRGGEAQDCRLQWNPETLARFSRLSVSDESDC